ncbi:MAG: VOC family protein [Halolamina sp.]|uniref:VOC family protein n=1 Tax=Halolamina sp. TaxID=1940283 RepID=UPI002FC357B7
MAESREFDEGVLGWHTVKRTQNSDDSGTRHYYFSSRSEGEPGTTGTYFEYTNGRGHSEPGASHQFAFGVEDRERLAAWREHLQDHGIRVSEPKDRTDFASIYVSDPDGLTFELRTHGPGFGVDEAEPGRTAADPFDDCSVERRR